MSIIIFLFGSFIFIIYMCGLTWDIHKENKEQQKYEDVCHYSGLPSVSSYMEEDKKRAN
tara:strand:+ start:264 stop:440 length:177 start_codon:yes stop_codon:yes gene_type:complete